MLIEIDVFGLRAKVDEADFLAADKLVQTELCYQQAGFIRRTTARSVDGRWLVLSLFSDAASAEATADILASSPIAAALRSSIDATSRSVTRFDSLD